MYTKKETQAHVAEICKQLWAIFLADMSCSAEELAEFRQELANIAVVAWNSACTSTSLEKCKEHIKKFAEAMSDDTSIILKMLFYAAEVKWQDYSDDQTCITSVTVSHKKNKPVITIEVDNEFDPNICRAFEGFFDTLPIDQIHEELKDLPQDEVEKKLHQLVGKHVDQCINESPRPTPANKSKKKKSSGPNKKNYFFRVHLIDYDDVYCDIIIPDNCTFADLHSAIFDAFNREEEHLYCFTYGDTQISLSWCKFEDVDELDATKTKLSKFDFKVGDKLEYLFDFGDTWQHTLELRCILPPDDMVTEPFIMTVHGDVPPQYDYEEDDVYDADDYEVDDSDVEKYPIKAPCSFHPKLWDLVHQKRPETVKNSTLISVEELDYVPSKKKVKNFVRGKIAVLVSCIKTETIFFDFPSLKELFRRDTFKSPLLPLTLTSYIQQFIAELARKKLISNISNEEFLSIFSAIKKDPDAPSQSFVHDMIWTALACFLLNHECSKTEFTSLIAKLISAIKKNKEITFFDLCLEEAAPAVD